MLCSYCSCYVSVSKFGYFFFTSRSAPFSTALPDSSPVIFARQTQGGSRGHGKGEERKRRDSIVFLLPNSPRAPLGEGCERRLGTSQQLYQNNATLSLQYVTLHFRDRHHRNHPFLFVNRSPIQYGLLTTQNYPV